MEKTIERNSETERLFLGKALDVSKMFFWYSLFLIFSILIFIFSVLKIKTVLLLRYERINHTYRHST